MARTLANDGEVGLVYRMDGQSYAVGLSKEQHQQLQVLVKMLGDITVYKKLLVDYVDESGMPATLSEKGGSDEA